MGEARTTAKEGSMGETRTTAVVVGVWSFACAGRLTGLILRADGTDPLLRISPPFRQCSV